MFPLVILTYLTTIWSYLNKLNNCNPILNSTPVRSTSSTWAIYLQVDTADQWSCWKFMDLAFHMNVKQSSSISRESLRQATSSVTLVQEVRYSLIEYEIIIWVQLSHFSKLNTQRGRNEINHEQWVCILRIAYTS